MEQVLKPVNIAGALLVVQVCLLSIMIIGLILNNKVSRTVDTNASLVILVLLGILSIVFVAFTRDFYPIWSPILGDIILPTIPRKNAFAIVFVTDIIVISILISKTGGSNISPFTNMLFLIPSLAIFLRETPMMFFLYAFMAFLIYMITFNIRPPVAYGNREVHISDLAHKVISFACLFLGVITGYITRPITI